MKTSKTKPVWGIVALVGLVAATTIEGSLILTAASVAIFAIGSYLGGYMTEDAGRETARRETNQPAAAGERRAA